MKRSCCGVRWSVARSTLARFVDHAGRRGGRTMLASSGFRDSFGGICWPHMELRRQTCGRQTRGDFGQQIARKKTS
ncbi:hypothetical protein EUGRSUZ_H03522 [Eucalyptus grandis]|uniref:Uncharacterized protein n=2 Tax=Eucalyptus grandis TaxID=71139 RepID=A0A059B4F0_EUCGR|nr:hypothetical protein EUGRSUZ_H03522 [Eucalyptus grandis]